jgi:hypothetical protein
MKVQSIIVSLGIVAAALITAPARAQFNGESCFIPGVNPAKIGILYQHNCVPTPRATDDVAPVAPSTSGSNPSEQADAVILQRKLMKRKYNLRY